METLFYILVVFACLASLTNLVILFFLVTFIVNMRDKQREFFSDMVEMFVGLDEVVSAPNPTPVVKNDRKKTWDEKFEEELAERERRMRSDSGLDDLPPPKATFGEPPVANMEAQEGLILRSQKGNMR